MNPTSGRIWRDEHGRLRETIPCPRCGRITPLLHPSAEVMGLHKWTPYEELAVNGCGHKVDFISVPSCDGGCPLIPILGEAT